MTKEIMIVGESPSHTRPPGQEDLPFSGRTSHILWDELNKYDVTREDCFVTNVVNKKLPKGKKPSDEDIEEGIIELRGYVESHRPLIIIGLGKIAAKAVTGYNIDMLRNSGQLHQSETLDNIWAIPILHPAAVARNPKLKQKFIDSIWVAINSLKTIKKTINK